MTLTAKKSDDQIQRDVIDELHWDTRLLTTGIGVGVRDGVVVLTGNVDSWARRNAAEKAAHHVAGVLDVANDIEVHPSSLVTRDDSQIAAAARIALQSDVLVPHEHIQMTVSHGVVTLAGEVEYWSQWEDAVGAIRNLGGVRLVINQLKIRPSTPPADLRPEIEKAVQRRAHREVDDLHLTIDDDGGVTVAGTVDSFGEKRAVLGAVRGTHGVRLVRDEIIVNVGR